MCSGRCRCGRCGRSALRALLELLEGGVYAPIGRFVSVWKRGGGRRLLSLSVDEGRHGGYCWFLILVRLEVCELMDW